MRPRSARRRGEKAERERVRSPCRAVAIGRLAKLTRYLRRRGHRRRRSDQIRKNKSTAAPPNARLGCARAPRAPCRAVAIGLLAKLTRYLRRPQTPSDAAATAAVDQIKSAKINRRHRRPTLGSDARAPLARARVCTQLVNASSFHMQIQCGRDRPVVVAKKLSANASEAHVVLLRSACWRS